MTKDAAGLDDMTGAVRATWQRVLDVFEPIRPQLYRYCRHLTHDPWDAEDLVQDTMARAFVTLGTVFGDVPRPKAWLFRVASNLWIDRVRRARKELPLGHEPDVIAADPRALREAAGTLLGRLSPQERVALVLADVFDFSLDEIADVLSTTVGAVKAALHRGRGKVTAAEGASSRSQTPSPAVLDAFCAAFNARDLDRLAGLLHGTATVEIVGLVTERGPEAPKDPRTGSFAGTLAPISHDERGGVRPELLEGYLGTAPRCDVRVYRGQPLLLFWYDHDVGPVVRTLMTIETDGDRIAHVRNYFFSPDVIADVCDELGVPHRKNGYRYW